MSADRRAVTVTISDPETGAVLDEREVDNTYALICAGNTYLSSSYTYPNGTTLLTIKKEGNR